MEPPQSPSLFTAGELPQEHGWPHVAKDASKVHMNASH